MARRYSASIPGYSSKLKQSRSTDPSISNGSNSAYAIDPGVDGPILRRAAAEIDSTRHGRSPCRRSIRQCSATWKRGSLHPSPWEVALPELRDAVTSWRSGRVAGGSRLRRSPTCANDRDGEGPVAGSRLSPRGRSAAASARLAPRRRLGLGSLDAYDPLCRALAAEGQCCVVAVDYRLAPEDPFPAAIEDAGRDSSGQSPTPRNWGRSARIAVGGDSAGGNLAAVTALRARESDVPSRSRCSSTR